jgi:hypothetical protein
MNMASKILSYKTYSSPQIAKKQPQRLSEILPPLLSCHQKFLLDNIRGRRALGHEGNLRQMLECENAGMYAAGM